MENQNIQQEQAWKELHDTDVCTLKNKEKYSVCTTEK
jgi:hypothetical protein